MRQEARAIPLVELQQRPSLNSESDGTGVPRSCRSSSIRRARHHSSRWKRLCHWSRRSSSYFCSPGNQRIAASTHDNRGPSMGTLESRNTCRSSAIAKPVSKAFHPAGPITRCGSRSERRSGATTSTLGNFAAPPSKNVTYMGFFSGRATASGELPTWPTGTGKLDRVQPRSESRQSRLAERHDVEPT